LRGEFAATGIARDLGAVYYPYPGDELEPEKDYVEPKLGLSHEFAGLPLMPRVSASVHYSPDFYLEAGDAVYVDLTVGMSLKGVLGGELPAHERLDLRVAPARHGQLFEARAGVDLEWKRQIAIFVNSISCQHQLIPSPWQGEGIGKS
jgi:hypothetical protein